MTRPNDTTKLAAWLRARGFDGLYFPGECACEADDLAPCGEKPDKCRPGYRTDGCEGWCGNGCDWHIGAKKPDRPAVG